MIERLLETDFWQRAAENPIDVFTFWLTVFTGILAVGTLGLWLATISVLLHARRSSEQQLRAYIGIEKASLRAPLKAGEAAHAMIDFVNRGLTPAKGVQAVIFIEVMHFPAKDDQFPVDFTRAESASDVSKDGVGHLSIDTSAPIAPDVFDDIVKGKLATYVWGEVRYRDVFNRHWRSEFRFRNHPKSHKPEGVYMIVCSDGNNCS